MMDSSASCEEGFFIFAVSTAALFIPAVGTIFDKFSIIAQSCCSVKNLYNECMKINVAKNAV